MTGASADDGLRSEINVTPLVDVMLVLLVIFMVVTPLLRMEMPVELPAASTASEVVDGGRGFTVQVEADGKLRLDDMVVSRDELGPALAAQVLAHPGEPVFLEADGAAAYARIVEVMDLVRKAGVARLQVLTAPAPQ